MIKVEVIEKFTLKKFKELENIKRADKEHEKPQYDGTLFANDEFECTEEMANYLTGKNPIKKVVVKVVEVIPEKIEPEVNVDEEIVLEATNKKKKASKK